MFLKKIGSRVEYRCDKCSRIVDIHFSSYKRQIKKNRPDFCSFCSRGVRVLKLHSSLSADFSKKERWKESLRKAANHSPQKKVKCEKCGREVGYSQITKHLKSCNRDPSLKRYIRKYPGTGIWNKGLTEKTDEIVKKYAASRRERVKSGLIKITHSEETKRKIGEKLRLNPYRRKCKSVVYYNEFRFDSTWEVKVAKILDKNNIKWIQPDPILWIDKKGKNHNYFSDFYLPDYHLYLDPKNEFCVKAQKEKLDYIRNHYKNVYVLSREQINEEHILN